LFSLILQNLFDPLNPDKDTIETRKWNPRERQENEFWLLQRLDDLMQKANFHELPDEIVNKALEEHVVSDGVRVGILYIYLHLMILNEIHKRTSSVSILGFEKQGGFFIKKCEFITFFSSFSFFIYVKNFPLPLKN
jgi:hypothetical protein